MIIPEKEMASKVAKGLISPNVLDYLPVSEDFTICEVAASAPFWESQSASLRLRGKYHIEVIAIRDVLSDRFNWSLGLIL